MNLSKPWLLPASVLPVVLIITAAAQTGEPGRRDRQQTPEAAQPDLTRLTRERDRLETRLEEVEAMLQRERRERQEIEKRLEDEGGVPRNVQERLDYQRETMVAMRARLEELAAYRESAQSELTGLRRDRDRLASEIDEAEQRLFMLERQYSESEDENRRRLLAAEREALSHRRRVLELEAQSASLQEEISENREELEEFRRDNLRQSQLLIATRRDLQAAREEKEELRAELKELREKTARAAETSTDPAAKPREQQPELQRKLDAYQERIAQQAEQLRRLKAQYEREREESWLWRSKQPPPDEVAPAPEKQPEDQ